MGFHHRAPPLLSALPCLLPLDIFRLVTLIYHRTEPPDAERSYRKCSVEGHSTVIKAIVLIPCSLSIPPPPLPLPPSIILDAISITLFTPTPTLLLSSVSTLPLGLSLRQSRGTETRRRSFRGTLILCSHNRSQNQSSPHAQPIHPRLLSFECALRRGWGGFGPTSGELPLRRQRLRHGELLLTSADTQRDTKTPGSAHPRSLSKRLASRLVEHRKLLNLFFLFLAFCPMPHPGLVGLTGLFL